MKIIVQPQKGSSYKLLFYDGRHVLGAGFVDLMGIPEGAAPGKVRLEWGGKKDHRHTPSKELIAQLRDADVQTVKPDPLFETFLSDFQSGRDKSMPAVCACWMSSHSLKPELIVWSGKSGRICLECGKRELCLSVPSGAAAAWKDTPILERPIFVRHPDTLTGCLPAAQPDKDYMQAALFDRLKPHPV